MVWTINFPLLNLLHRVGGTIIRVWTKPTSCMRYWVRNYHNWGPGMDPGVFHIWGGLRTMGDDEGMMTGKLFFLVKNQQTWVFEEIDISWYFMIFYGISPATMRDAGWRWVRSSTTLSFIWQSRKLWGRR